MKMSTYYEYQDVKVAIARCLMKIEGWHVYGFHEDNSDPMTDYWDPAYWGGIAEKNGYILCVKVYGAEQPQEIRQYNYCEFSFDASIKDKIEKLERMTVERGASESEAESARKMILRLREKAQKETENRNKYTVTGMIPGHLANPPRCNWHIEKDGVIIEKGTGLLKYAKITDYFTYERYAEDLKKYKEDPQKYQAETAEYLWERGYYSTMEEATHAAERNAKEMEEKLSLINKFEELIRKFDSTCGGMLGEGDSVIYEKVKVTKYKKEMKVVESSDGMIRDGQYFILKADFNYGRRRGLVYKICKNEYKGKEYFTGYKLNGKLTKICTGHADPSNRFSAIESERFLNWIQKGVIAWCELREEKVPYEVEKVVKKKVSNNTRQADEYEIIPSEHTKTHEKIWLVKVNKSLSKEEFTELKNKFSVLKGYYSRYTHSFVFKYDPTEILSA